MSDFDAVKSTLGPQSVSVPPLGYLRCFKSDIDTAKSKDDLLNK